MYALYLQNFHYAFDSLPHYPDDLVSLTQLVHIHPHSPLVIFYQDFFRNSSAFEESSLVCLAAIVCRVCRTGKNPSYYIFQLENPHFHQFFKFE